MLITFNWSLNTLKQRFPVARMFPQAVMHTSLTASKWVSSRGFINKLTILESSLNDPLISTKTYWLIHTTSFNGIKAPFVPPFFINIKYVTNFQEKSMLLTLLFQNNARRFQAIVSCLWKYQIWQRTVFQLVKVSFFKKINLKLSIRYGITACCLN